jgi:lipopolysaccharide/colanic/teichoic acid biosynthesis glycosyltransferase
LRDEPEEPTRFRPLIRVLKERLRTTDSVGWIDARHLGVVLPYTPPQGADKVARDAVAACAADLPSLDYRIFCYPELDLNEVRPSEPVPREAAWKPAVVLSLEPLLIRPLPAWKRALDIVGATVGLLLLWPVLLLAAAAIRYTSPGPVFFAQKRSGLGGRPFTIYKFRTMTPGAHLLRDSLVGQNEQDGPAFKIRRDPRVTPVGRLLRATSIDELPQLWNVLRGEMSLVGPRPLPCEESNACRGWRRRRPRSTIRTASGPIRNWRRSSRSPITPSING